MNVWAANLKALIFIRGKSSASWKKHLWQTERQREKVGVGRGRMCTQAIFIHVCVSLTGASAVASIFTRSIFFFFNTVLKYRSDWPTTLLQMCLISVPFFGNCVQAGDVEQLGHPRHPLLPQWGRLPVSWRLQMCGSGGFWPQQTRAGL